jgi:spore maturation protein CgeB
MCRWDLGYLGTYSSDRQPVLDRLLLEVARRWPQGRFAVVGPQYPETIEWPVNVRRIMHLPPAAHRAFYNAQAFTLNITRADMARAGYAPSIRLFEAGACGVPIISDYWEGLETFFEPGREILIARSTDDVLRILRETPPELRMAIAQRARQRILAAHTAAHRARQLEDYVMTLMAPQAEDAER